MPKITVVLTAVMNDDKTIRQPGESLALEESQAVRLAALGMVRLPKKARAKNDSKASAKDQIPPPKEPDGEFDPDGGGGDQEGV
jgi:hypothetical protein